MRNDFPLAFHDSFGSMLPTSHRTLTIRLFVLRSEYNLYNKSFHPSSVNSQGMAQHAAPSVVGSMHNLDQPGLKERQTEWA